MAKRNKGRSPRPRHDAAFKSLYDFDLMARDLLALTLPRALLDTLDFGTLERLPAEWFSRALEGRRGDCVWRLRRRGGGSLVAPVEFQSRPDRLMPFRVNAYAALLAEGLARRGELDPGGRLPLLRPVVLHGGEAPWRGPTGLAELAPAGEPAGPAFALVDMGRVRVEDLPRDNAVAAQIEIHQGALARDPDGVLGRMAKRLGGPEHRALRAAFVAWTMESVRPGMASEPPDLEFRLKQIAELGELQDMESLVLKSMKKIWLEEGMEQGLARGMARGMKRGMARAKARARADERARLRRLAGRKFGERAAERLAAAIQGVTDAERLDRAGDWIIDCGTEAEFLAQLQPGTGRRA